MEKIIDFIFILILAGIVTVFIISINIDNKEYIYKCTDYKGDIVFCTNAYTSKGGMFGYLEDGTKITITSYKRVLREE